MITLKKKNQKEFSFVKESLGATMNQGHIDAKEFIAMLHENYDNQIFAQGQKFICSHFGVLLYAEVKEMEIYETKSLTENQHKMSDDDNDDGKSTHFKKFLDFFNFLKKSQKIHFQLLKLHLLACYYHQRNSLLKRIRVQQSLSIT